MRGDNALRRIAPGNPARRFAEIVTTVAELRPTMIDASSVLRRKAGAALFVVGFLVVAPCASPIGTDETSRIAAPTNAR